MNVLLSCAGQSFNVVVSMLSGVEKTTTRVTITLEGRSAAWYLDL